MMPPPLRYSDVAKRGAPATTGRRDALLDWLREREKHHGLTAREIADASGIYDSLQGRQEKASADLRVLLRCGFVKTNQRIGGRWWLASEGESS